VTTAAPQQRVFWMQFHAVAMAGATNGAVATISRSRHRPMLPAADLAAAPSLLAQGHALALPAGMRSAQGAVVVKESARACARGQFGLNPFGAMHL